MQPIRSCVHCRKKLGKKELIRYCLEKNVIIEDSIYIRPGRGVYLCPECKVIFEEDNEKLKKRMFHELTKTKRNGKKD